jgi:putative oxidoreductase
VVLLPRFKLNFLPCRLEPTSCHNHVVCVWIGTSLFLRHSLEKLFGSTYTVSHFPDPLHLGAYISFAVATLSDGLCSILVVLAFATRCSALLISSNIFVAWALVVHFQFFAKGVSPGEAIVLYLGGFLTIALAGPGRFSIDAGVDFNKLAN